MFANWNDIFSKNLNYNTVINGNSRAWVQYNPAILDSVTGCNSYNLGTDGSSVNRQIFKYKTYCRLNQPPQYLIQNIDYSTLDITIGYEREQFLPYFNDRTFVNELPEQEFDFLEKTVPFVRYFGYRELILRGLKLNNSEIYTQHLKKGFAGQDRSWDGSALSQIDTVYYAHNTEAIEIFRDFLKELVSKNVKIVFVFAPTYIEATNKTKNIDQMFHTYKNIAGEFGIPILDYTYSEISYDTMYFYNANHLNKKGADMFSEKLGRDLNRINFFVKE